MPDLIGLIDVQKEAESFLRQNFLGPSRLTREERIALIRPKKADYDAVFGERADQVRAKYEEGLWGSGFLPEPKAGQTEIQVFAADPTLLAEPNTASDRFPGGYRDIADQLAPNSAWVAFRYHAPGETNGMFYDGLVPRPEGRWVWFPKPWRVLGD